MVGMARPILIANWKNYPNSLSEAKTLLAQLSRNRSIYKKVSLFIAPPLPYLESVSSRSRSFARLAVQGLSPVLRGVHTGVVTPDILKSLGVKLSILGHSEERAMGETNEQVAKKTRIALNSGFMPLVCVGEPSRDDDGLHFEFLREELKFSLAGLNRKVDASKLAIAYEPIWAIGKRAQDAISPTDLAETIIFIRKVLTDMFDRKIAERVTILYGGSVEASNASALFKGTGIKGFLVGHASLDAKDFLDIAKSLI